MTSVEQDAATTGDVLRRAAGLLRENGWCRGQLDDETGAHCVLGAVRRARGQLLRDFGVYGSPEERLLQRTLTNFAPHYRSVEDWNDADGRIQAEAEKFLLFAADRADFPAGA